MGEKSQQDLLMGEKHSVPKSGTYGAVNKHHVIECHSSLGASRPPHPNIDGSTKEFPWVQVTLVSAAMVGMVLVVAVFAHDTSPWDDFFTRGLWHAVGNLSAAFLFFFSSDVIAQILPTVQTHHRLGFLKVFKGMRVKYARAFRCGCLGIVVNGFGYYAWVHALNILIPQREVDRDQLHAFGLLIGKALLDSCLWGTTSNSVGILGRRLLEGDSTGHAIDVWAAKILDVTVWELRFWPFWSACQFYVVPNKLQVIFTSFGALLWNCYISFTALSDPVDRTEARIRVDGVASPVRTFRPRRSLDSEPADLTLDDEFVDDAENSAHGRRKGLLYPGRAKGMRDNPLSPAKGHLSPSSNTSTTTPPLRFVDTTSSACLQEGGGDV